MFCVSRMALPALLFIAPFTSSPAMPASPAKTFYVSPFGNDENPGIKTSPFATLDRAVRAVRENPGGPATIYLREGFYPLPRTIVLDQHDSTPEAPLVIRSYPGEQAYITGGQEIRGFEALTPRSRHYDKILPEFRDHVMTIDLKVIGITEFGKLSARGFGRAIQPSGLELYCNGKPMTLARWPNSGWTRIADAPDALHGTGFVYDGNRPSRWTDAQDAWLHGYWKWDWADCYVQIARIDTANKTILTKEPHSSYPYTKGKRFYALNLLEELDYPGEWYLDRDSGTLYFWPPADIARARIFVSLLQEPMLSLQNTRNITLQDLTFEYTCGAGIEIVGGRDNTIKGCTIRNIGTVAVGIGKLIPNPGGEIYKNTLYNGQAGHNNGVSGCRIYAAGEGGIILGGGDRATLSSSGNYVVNSEIYDCSRWVRTYRAAISMYGVGNIVKHNLIHDLPHTAIFFRGNDHIIEYNEIHHVCMETGDAGALYNGRDWTQRGTLIRYNYFHHLHGVEGQDSFTDVMAVYLDDWSSGATIFGNIFYKAGRSVMIGGGRDNLVENNIFIDGAPAIHVDARGKGWAKYYFDGTDSTLFTRLKAVHPDRPPYSERYPQLVHLLEDNPALPKGNRIIRNISSGGTWIEFFDAVFSKPLVYFKDNAIDVDKSFLLSDDGRFRIRYESPAMPPGFQPIPLEKIGLNKKEKKRILRKEDIK